MSRTLPPDADWIADVVHAPGASDLCRVSLCRPPEGRLVDPIGFAHEAFGQAERAEHLYRPAGDPVGMTQLERSLTALDDASGDVGELSQLCGENGSGRPRADDEDVDFLGELRRLCRGV